MKKYKKLLIVITLMIILFLISFLYIKNKGQTYTLVIQNHKLSLDETEIIVSQDKKIVEIIDKKMNGNNLEITVKSVSEGKANIEIKINENYFTSFMLYVHKSGIITDNNFFGKATGDYIIPMASMIILFTIFTFIFQSYKKNMHENIYQYRNVAYLGILILLVFAIIDQILLIFNYNGVLSSITFIFNIANLISIFMLPIAFIVSIFVTINGIILIKKEGFSFKNLLGILLGIFLCVMTIIPEALNIYLQTHLDVIDVHNLNGIGYVIQMLVESLIYVIIAYLECVLLATIILSVKAAKRIPEFNKDYIVILGCMVNKDGSLTKLLKSRVDRAIEFRNMQKENTGKDLIFVPSGGKGNDEVISEGEAIKNYLLEQGIKEEDILVENKSTSTLENLKFSNKLINNEKANIAFSTTNFHVFRAGVIGTSMGLKLEGIGSKTKRYFWINAFIREFVATLYSEKKKHILVILTLIILMVFMVFIVHISNQI